MCMASRFWDTAWHYQFRYSACLACRFRVQGLGFGQCGTISSDTRHVSRAGFSLPIFVCVYHTYTCTPCVIHLCLYYYYMHMHISLYCYTHMHMCYTFIFLYAYAYVLHIYISIYICICVIHLYLDIHMHILLQSLGMHHKQVEHKFHLT